MGNPDSEHELSSSPPSGKPALSSQSSLFNIQPQPWQLDDQDDWLAARIAFAEAPFGPYDYSIPPAMETLVRPGIRVEVPLGRGNRQMTGYCVDVIGPFHPLAASVNPQAQTNYGRRRSSPLITPACWIWRIGSANIICVHLGTR